VGESARRKKEDPFYGKVPKNGKGIVISNPVTIEENGSFTSLGGGVNPIELRRATLFWDRINKPSNNVISLGDLSPDEKFLKECGILQELKVQVGQISGDIGSIYTHLHLAAFAHLERMEPGLWALSEGENSFNLRPNASFSQGRGALVELHRAIPLPTAEVPLSDLLEFKEKRRDEILSLTLELDGLFSKVVNSEDTHFELSRAIAEVDKKYSDVIKAGKDSKIKFSLSDFSYGFSLEVSSGNLLTSGAVGAIMGGTFGLPLVGGIIGAAASTIKFNVGLGGKLSRSDKSAALALSPYRVVSRLINEPI